MHIHTLLQNAIVIAAKWMQRAKQRSSLNECSQYYFLFPLLLILLSCCMCTDIGNCEYKVGQTKVVSPESRSENI